MINCPYCGKLTDPKLDTCPHCGGYVQKKLAGRTPEPRKSVGQTCPSCHALVQDGDIICVGCGTNLLTGQKIAEEKTRVARERRNWLPWAALAGVAFILLVVAVVFAFYAFTRDPVKRAVQLAYTGNLLEAGNLLSKHVASHADDARAHFELGRVQWKMGRMPEAATAFESAYKLDDKNTDAAMLAVAALGNSRDNASRQRQIAILRGLTQYSPNNGEAWYLLALALGTQDDVDGQIAALKEAIAAGADVAGARGSMALALGIKGEFEAAQQELMMAAQSGEADEAAGADIDAAAGFISSLAGKYDVSRTRLQQAIEKDTTVKGQALTRLGMLLLSEGRPLDAAPYLAEAAERDKRNTLAQFFHAAALEAEGKNNEALTVLEALSKAGDALSGEASVRGANLYLAQGNYDKAREMVSRAESASVDTAGFHTVRGRVFIAAGEPERATEAFNRARQVDPQYAGVYLELGLLHIRQQQFTEAVAQLDKYIELAGPQNDLARTGQVAALVAQLKQAASAPGQPDASAGGIAGRSN